MPPHSLRPDREGALMPADDGDGRRLRSRRWFDEPSDPAMTALYLERYMNYGITLEELRGGSCPGWWCRSCG